jgi:hypothetical protein
MTQSLHLLSGTVVCLGLNACLLAGIVAAADPIPVVFWATDGLEPGDAVLFYGDGLDRADMVRVWRVPDDPSAPEPLTAPPDAIATKTFQAAPQSLKFLLPESLRPGVFAVAIPHGPTVVLNRPQPWFLQPVRLEPGLVENEAAPGSSVQVIGKDFLVPQGAGPAAIELRTPDGRSRHGLAIEKSEKFSLTAAVPASLPPGRYHLVVSNGHGGPAAWSDPLPIEIKIPAAWPTTRFDVRDFGAKGDDTTDDTDAIVAALAAAEENGGGVVDFPWGTYRLTRWIRIPPRTTLRGAQRDATILKWPIDEPKAETDFIPAAIYGDTSYALENLTLVVCSATTILHDLGSAAGVPAELRDRVSPGGSRDVFLRRVAFHHWLLCGHPDRNPVLATRLHGPKAWNFSNPYGSIRTFEVSDCLFQGASQQFANIRNARIVGNSFSNTMGYCWTCLGAGAWFTVAEGNDLRCSSSWGYGLIGMNRIYSAHNTSHNFVAGEREAMTLDISATPATPAGPLPKGRHPIVGRNIAWFGSPREVRPDGFRVEGIKAGDDEFAGKTVLILDGPGAGQFREITRNRAGDFSLDRPWDVPPTTASIVGLWDLCRYMIVHDCSAVDTSAFAQLYGSFYEYIVDGCTVDRCGGCWGQSGWFVQFRSNTIRHAHTFHRGIGMPGKNRERNATFGYTGLTDGNLRISKFGSAQYDSPPDKPLFVRDVVSRPVPGVRGCIIRRNTLEFNQRIMFGPDRDPLQPPRPDDFLRMTDALIDGNAISRADVGVFVGGSTTNVLVTSNHFEEVQTPIVCNPDHCTVVP